MWSSEYILIYILFMKVVMVSELLITYGPHNAGSSAVIQSIQDLFYLWFLQTKIFASIFNEDCVPLTDIPPSRCHCSQMSFMECPLLCNVNTFSGLQFLLVSKVVQQRENNFWEKKNRIFLPFIKSFKFLIKLFVFTSALNCTNQTVLSWSIYYTLEIYKIMKAVDNVFSELLFTKSHNLRRRGQSDKPAETILKHIREGRVDSKLLDDFATQICCEGRQMSSVSKQDLDSSQKPKHITVKAAPPWESEGGGPHLLVSPCTAS